MARVVLRDDLVTDNVSDNDTSGSGRAETRQAYALTSFSSGTVQLAVPFSKEATHSCKPLDVVPQMHAQRNAQ